MLRSCKKDAAVLEILSPRLQLDRDVVEAAVGRVSVDVLMYFPSDSQCMYPDLVVKALSNFWKYGNEDEENDNDHMEYVAEDLWTNLDVTKAWLMAGGIIFDDQFPETISKSKEFGLILVDFDENVPEALRSDKEFMLQAVEKDSLTFFGRSRWFASGF
jgi:hypothetical protein